MDGCSVCAQGTVSRSSSFTLQICIYSRRAGREGRDSVLWHSPEAPGESPFLRKPTPAQRAHMHLSAWACGHSGHAHRLLVAVCPIGLSRSHMPSALRSPHSVPPGRWKTWPAATSEAPEERQGVHSAGSIGVQMGAVATSGLWKARLGKQHERWWRRVSQ